MLYPVNVRGHEIRFYLDSGAVAASSGLDARMERIRAALHLLPQEHVELIVEPIIVVDELPSTARRGGGWFAPGSGPGRASAWMEPRRAARTGVAPDEIERRIGGLDQGTGIIGITSYSFLRDDNWGLGQPAHHYTILHEVGHAVDYHTGPRHNGLIPPAGLPGRSGNAPYQGQRYPRPTLGELAAEAYSRFFLRPNSMCRGHQGTPPCIQPDGTPATAESHNQRWCSARLQRDLQASPAFQMCLGSVTFTLAWAATGREAPEFDAWRRGERARPLSGTGTVRGGPRIVVGASWRRPGPIRAA